MTKRTKYVDLEALCQQIFLGVYRCHGEKIINERRALLFNEASKAMYLAGYSDSEIEVELSSLQECLEKHLKSTENTSASPSKEETLPASDTRLSDEKIGTIRNRQACDDQSQGKQFRPEPSPEKKSKPNKFIVGISSVFKFSLALAAMSGVAFLLGEHYEQFTKIEHPSLSYNGPIDDHYKDALVDCKDVVLSREHLGRSDPEYLGSADPDTEAGYVGGGKVNIAFSDKESDCILIRSYEKVKKRKLYAEEYETRTGYKVYSPEYWEEQRLESWQDDYRHRIIAGVEKSKPIINCNIEIDDMPHRNERSLFNSELEDINQWISESSEEFDQCLKNTLANAPDKITNFMVDLVSKLNEEESIDHDRNYAFLKEDVLIHETHLRVQKKWFEATNQYSEKVFAQWDSFRGQVLTPRLERGAKLEQEWARERAEAKYAKEFKDMYGKNPDDLCSYQGRTVRCDQAPWVTEGLNGWDDGVRTLNKISEFSRQANEDRKRRAQAKLDELVWQYEAQQAINDYKNPCGPDVFHDKPHRDCLPVLTDGGAAETVDWEESQRRADQKDREMRAYYADKKKQESESRKTSVSSLCSDPDNANKCYCIPRSQWSNPEGNCVMDK